MTRRSLLLLQLLVRALRQSGGTVAPMKKHYRPRVALCLFGQMRMFPDEACHGSIAALLEQMEGVGLDGSSPPDRFLYGLLLGSGEKGQKGKNAQNWRSVHNSFEGLAPALSRVNFTRSVILTDESREIDAASLAWHVPHRRECFGSTDNKGLFTDDAAGIDVSPTVCTRQREDR